MSLFGLDGDQQAAVDNPADKLVCVAGPGSGKTRVLVARAARELERFAPQEILVLTYTVAGAREFSDRLASSFGRELRLGHCGTLHSLCLDLLKRQRYKLRIPEAVEVLDREESAARLQAALKEVGCKCSAEQAGRLSTVSYLYELQPGRPYSKLDLAVAEYHRKNFCAGKLDFGEVLYLGYRAVDLMKEEGSWPYESLLLDEAQDCGEEDWAAVHSMPCLRKFAVGDPGQSVFSFRGAAPEIFTGMSVAWECCQLRTNYRSREAIVEASDKFSLWKHKAVRPGGSVEAFQCEYDWHERHCVAGEVEGALTRGQTVAVLARTRRVAELHKQFLESRGLKADSNLDYDPEFSQTGERLYIGTCHSAKGREWDKVVVAGCEEGLFPSRQSDVHEERRLFYVALTRAREAAVFFWCRSRSAEWPLKPLTGLEPSRFLAEIARKQ